MKILKSYEYTKSYVDNVRFFADSNKQSFGFLPASAYKELALTGRLWVLVSKTTKEMQGYLLFGENYPVVRVYQLFVVGEYRKKGIAKKLINELISFAESNNFSTIRAKVAAELSANRFWERNNFLITKQSLGGTERSKTRRQLNFRSYTLNTPDLFKETQKDNTLSFSYPDKPQFSLPIFTIDLNVLYDITKKRKDSDKAKQVFEYGLTGAFRLCLTPEFKNELERTQNDKNNDPIYAIAEAFPTLEVVDDKILTPLSIELRRLIFPDRKLDNRTAHNDKSDSIHLAYCAINKVGFITRENSILRQSPILKDKYGITVVSPTEIDFGEASDESLSVNSDDNILDFKSLNTSNISYLDNFLTNIGLEKTLIKSINSRRQGTPNLNEQFAFANNDVVGFCSWNTPNSLSSQIDCYLYINEANIHAVKVIDHFIEKTIRDACSNIITRIDLHVEKKQGLTKTTAKKKGYLSTSNENMLTKVALNGFITKNNWKVIIDKFSVLTSRDYPSEMPESKDLINTGIRVKEKNKVHSNCLSLFKFESIISPGVVLHEDRQCLLIPIKENYAKDLLGFTNPQQSLFPHKCNSLLLEKAYFRKPRNSSYFKKGGLIAFYVSGDRKEIIGTARITYTDELSLEQINLNIHRQGVLSKKELKELLNKDGKLHVFTFDNFKEFSNKIPFKTAQELKLISKANLVTVERLSFPKLKLLIKTAYSL